LGIETIWVADHLADRGGQLRYHGWTCLAALAEQTSRARIGTLVSPMTLHNPAVLAKAALTVDTLVAKFHQAGGDLAEDRLDGSAVGDVRLEPRDVGVDRSLGARLGPSGEAVDPEVLLEDVEEVASHEARSTGDDDPPQGHLLHPPRTTPIVPLCSLSVN